MVKKILRKEDSQKISTKLLETTTNKPLFKISLEFKDKFPVNYQIKIFIPLKVHSHLPREKSLL